MGYQLETTALISIDNYNAFRIRCIMLILDKLTIYSMIIHLGQKFSTNYTLE
jgi:hypothetical protein